MRAIRLPLRLLRSVNQRSPSGPSVILLGWLSLVMPVENSLTSPIRAADALEGTATIPSRSVKASAEDPSVAVTGVQGDLTSGHGTTFP